MAMIVWRLLMVVLVVAQSASAAVIESTWEVEYKFWWSDCKEAIVMAINGSFPGPTIEAVTGDTVIIHVINKLSTEGVVIHWHGIRQYGTPWADGAAGLTQCAISPGETITYKFIVDKAGTHFYHGHYGMQRSAGLYGMLIVRSLKERLQYDGESIYCLVIDGIKVLDLKNSLFNIGVDSAPKSLSCINIYVPFVSG